MARPRKPVITEEKVVAAAVAIIGEQGLPEFSMHKLAAALGVRAPSLYYHFADKNALLAAVARSVTAMDVAPETPPPGVDWTDYLIRQAVALRGRILRYPHCAPLLVQFMPRGDMFGEYEAVCGYLLSCGVPSRLHVRIVDGLTALTIGAAFLNENAAHYAVGGVGPTPDQQTYPLLRSALATVEGSTPDQMFARYVETYLDGIRAQVVPDPV